MSEAEAPASLPATAVSPPAEATGDQDRPLVDRARAGDTGAFETLVRRHQGWVFTLAVRMLGDRAEAEDMAQEIFLKAYRGLKRFRGASRFSTWLHAIASHHCLNQVDARRRRPRPQRWAGDRPDHGENDSPSVVERLADQAPRADALVERTDLARLVQAELANLTAEHRIILVLRDIQGLSYEEIAQALRLELGTVRSRLHRARMEMRARLTPYL
ncbi:MAG: RNA polymerase sigma factor [Candidatus Methylomirabilales bacterium]